MTDFPPIPRATRQSPISLLPEFITPVESDYLRFDWPASVIAHPHTPPAGAAHRGTRFSILAGPQTSGGITLAGHRYLLRELHFHAPSEHFADAPGTGAQTGEQQFAGEIHLVHRSPVDARIAVVSVFLDAVASDSAVPREDSDGAIRAFLAEAVSQIKGKVSETPVEFSPRGLLPRSPVFFRYQGSLTTEPFAENVSWIVMAEPIACDDPDLKTLGARVDDDDARPIQDRDRRIIVRCVPRDPH
ncbi:MAG: carbonic anhydrase family protein [Myxococcales bacterium]|nr:carbonic anhydrase family protein [Myxococcales bacterium]